MSSSLSSAAASDSLDNQGNPMSTSTALLETHDLGHTYGIGEKAHVALKAMDFSIARGELVSIVGPSGAGKTTLLKCVSGLINPTEGEVLFLGERVESVPTELAVVFQDYSRSLYPWMSVAKNVAFPLTQFKLSKQERAERVAISLEQVGLKGLGERYPWQLSGGMQQRVAIARALAYKPEVLLMDEPFASVDAQTRSDLEDLVLSLKTDLGMTILFVTHDVDESVYLSDRVLVLSSNPASVIANLDVHVPWPRDQISTKALPEFVEIRTEVAGLIRASSEDAKARALQS
jgi:NitT/TauT family transport system ATP-binding protein